MRKYTCSYMCMNKKKYINDNNTHIQIVINKKK